MSEAAVSTTEIGQPPRSGRALASVATTAVRTGGAAAGAWGRLHAVAWALALAVFSSCSIELPAEGQGSYLGSSGDAASGDSCADGTGSMPCGADAGASGCAGSANGKPCSDGDPKTAGETCVDGVCGSGKPFCDFLVTTLADSGTGACTAEACTLRDAIDAAMAATAAQAPTIAFAVEGTVALQAPLPTITRSVTIDGGAGAPASTATQRIWLDGGGLYRILSHKGGLLTLRALGFRKGAAQHGGAVHSEAPPATGLVIESCSFNDNVAQDSGGAVVAGANTVIRHTTFTGNQVALAHSYALGGAVVVYGLTEVTDSLFVANTCGNQGGGLAAATGSDATVRRSTFANNSALSGGGMVSYSKASLTNVTFVGNGGTTCTQGGGLDAGGTASLIHVTFANNTCKTKAQLNISGGELINSLVSGSGSIGQCGLGTAKVLGNFASAAGCGATSVGDPGLGSLGNNGGTTPTVRLLPGSPAIDAGSASGCGPSTTAATDQRGVARPQGGGCDCGAVEVGPGDCPAGLVGVGNRCVNTATALFRVGFTETTLSGVEGLFLAAPGNLLQNGGAETGDLTGWQVINGGKGWALVEGIFGKSSFVGSWDLGWLTQEVDLLSHGLSAASIDGGTAPPVLAGLTAVARGPEGVHFKPGTEDQVTLRIAPVDAAGKVGPDLAFQVLDCPHGILLGLHVRLATLPKGTRKLLVAVGGVDTEHFAENFAAATDGIYLSLGDLEMRLANQEEPFGPWQPYAGTVKGWQLAPGSGKKQVRVEFRDAATQVPLGGLSDGIDRL